MQLRVSGAPGHRRVYLGTTPLRKPGELGEIIVVGNFVGFTFAKSDTGCKSDAWVELWENQRKNSAAAVPAAPGAPVDNPKPR